MQAIATVPAPIGVYTADDVSFQRAMPDEYDFFPVSPVKFALLSLFTLGIYEVYWSYQNWERIRLRTGEKLSPLWRAIFAPLWSFSLFDRMRRQLAEASVPVPWNASLLAAAYLLLTLCWRLPGAWWLITLAGPLSFLPIVQSVRTMTRRTEAAEGRNESFSAANVLTIALGAIFLALALLGSLVETPA